MQKINILNTVHVFLRLLWELPQTILGAALLGWYRIKAGRALEKIRLQESSIFLCRNMNGGVSLGRFIFIYTFHSSALIRHEYGHSIQSKMLGPFYLPVIGIPSISWALLYRFLSRRNTVLQYTSFYTEKWAEKLGKAHLSR